MPHLAINNINLYYECRGSGPPLMLIAGLASDSQSWQPIAGTLSRHFSLIMPDNRGAGRTIPQNCETNIQAITNDCIALIKHLGFSSVNLLGHSMGGFVALDCAIRYPQYVNNLVLAGSSALTGERNKDLFLDWCSLRESEVELSLWFRTIFYWLFTRGFFENERTLNDAVRLAVTYPYPQSNTMFRNQVMSLLDYDYSASLSSVHARTLILQGKEDLLFPVDEISGLLNKIPDSTITIIEKAAHSLHLEQPGDFCSIICTFIKNK